MMVITEDQMRDRLRKACEAAGGQSAFAREVGTSRQYISQILAGQYPAPEHICRKLKLTGERRRFYVVSEPPERRTP